MTTEEKAKAYDEALETARKINSGEGVAAPPDWTICEVIFPELKESGDEKVRKALIALLNFGLEDGSAIAHGFDETKEQALAWLEKQGEQRSKLVDFDYNANDSDLQEVTYFIPNGFHAEIDGNKVVIKQGEQKSAFGFNAVDWQPSKADGKIHNIYNSEVEPKFKVGDWITNGEYTWFIEGMHNRFYDIISPEGCGTDDTIIHVDGHFHLWTIKDAKDGDVLVHNDCTFIFKGIKDGIVQAIEENILEPVSFGKPDEDNDYHPATKEQRDQLKKAMTDAGYTFDFEKKKLRKIEQKPAWSEEDELIALSIEHVMNCASLLNIVPDKIDKIRAWLKSLKDRYTWKPSDEQMAALSSINVTGGVSYVGQGQELINLYNDLKKLMEDNYDKDS